MVMVLRTEVEEKEDFYIHEIMKGKLIIYPTDTIYGIGCDATNEEAVKKIRLIKERNDLPFTVIPPSLEWVKENCEITEEAKELIKKFPGSTLILKLKNKEAVAKQVNLGIDTIGVRIPVHWFTEILQKTNKPIITTSVNKKGEPNMTSMDDLDPDIQVDYVFFEGEKKGSSSKIFDLTGKEVVIKR